MYSITGPYGTVFFSVNADEFVVSVIGRGVHVNGSPVIIRPDEPIGPISEISFGDLYTQLTSLVG